MVNKDWDIVVAKNVLMYGIFSSAITSVIYILVDLINSRFIGPNRFLSDKYTVIIMFLMCVVAFITLQLMFWRKLSKKERTWIDLFEVKSVVIFGIAICVSFFGAFALSEIIIMAVNYFIDDDAFNKDDVLRIMGFWIIVLYLFLNTLVPPQKQSWEFGGLDT